MLLVAGAAVAAVLTRLPRTECAAARAVRRRRDRRRAGRGRGCAQSTVGVAPVHRLGGGRQSRPARVPLVEPALAMVEAGVARFHAPSARRHGRGVVPRDEPALPQQLPRRDDRAARPSGAVPVGGRDRRLPALRRIRRVPVAREPAPARPRPRARADLPGVPAARARRHRLGLRRRVGARVPRRGIACRRAGASRPRVRDARGCRRRCACVRGAPAAVARPALGGPGPVLRPADADDLAREPRARRRPASRRAVLGPGRGAGLVRARRLLLRACDEEAAAERTDLAEQSRVRAHVRVRARSAAGLLQVQRARPVRAPDERAGRLSPRARAREQRQAEVLARAEHDDELRAVQHRRLHPVERADDRDVQVVREPVAFGRIAVAEHDDRRRVVRALRVRSSADAVAEVLQLRSLDMRDTGASVAVQHEHRRPSARQLGHADGRRLDQLVRGRSLRLLHDRSRRGCRRMPLDRVRQRLREQQEAEQHEHDQLDARDQARGERRQPPGADQGIDRRQWSIHGAPVSARGPLTPS